jgi:hypothetical protein
MARTSSKPIKEGNYDQNRCHYLRQDNDQADLLSRHLIGAKVQWEPSEPRHDNGINKLQWSVAGAYT